MARKGNIVVALVPLLMLGLGLYGFFVLSPSATETEEMGSWEPPPEDESKLPLIYNAKLGFTHITGTSPCPQEAGGISVGAISKVRTELSNLTVTGDIAPLLTVAPLAPTGVRITLMAEFNCAVMEKGVYSGAIEADITDPQSGKTNHISVPVVGEIK